MKPVTAGISATVAMLLCSCVGETRSVGDAFGSGGAETDVELSSDDDGGPTGADSPEPTGSSADETSATSAASDSDDPIFDVGIGDTEGPGHGGEGCVFIDVLFIVDISGSMAEEKANLAQNFPAFVQVLDDYIASDGNAAGYRIGVTNSSIDVAYDFCTNTSGLDGALFGGSAVSGDCGAGGMLWLE